MLSVSLSLIWALLSSTTWSMRADHMARLRQETVDMFYHGYNNYMQHAFPDDELRPLTCGPLTRDRQNPALIGLNDVLGNYSLTLIDSLSTLAILASAPEDEKNTRTRALEDFQDGIASFVLYYGDGRTGPTGKGIRAAGFDLDSKVQVFETVIRGVGGLLSAHLFAIGELPITGYDPEPMNAASGDDPLELPPVSWPNGFKYDGQLLRLALDLAQRLLPAFYTETGIPYPRVNLRHGIPFYVNSPLHQASGEQIVWDGEKEITETCSAGASSLTLEFTVLSRLTGDPRFEQAAKRAFWEVWNRRSQIGLIGNGIDAERGIWINPHAGIGAGMDSFFEYALKSHILLSGNDMPNMTAASRRQSSTAWLDPNSIHGPLTSQMHSSDAFLKAWHEAHASVKRYLYNYRSHYPYYSNSHRATGQPYTMWIDSLGAFYPGLLALAGELDEAIEANLVYTALWTRYSALPERWSVRDNNVESGIGWWPGRPEFIESTYHIYRATEDPWYLYVGKMVLRDIQRRCHTPCGWAGLNDVRTGEKSDRMESFFLGETAKYMYLLFDPEHALNKLDAPYVFSTEGHPLILPKKGRQRRRPSRLVKSTEMALYRYYDENFTNTCPSPGTPEPLGRSATAARPDLYAVSRFTDLHNTPNLHGSYEAIEVKDNKKGRVIKYRPTSNHTFFPWTLPNAVLPENGTCEAPSERIVSWIEFPSTDAASSVLSRFGTAMAWLDYRGPTIKNLEGLRVQLEQGESEAGQGPVWRITNVGNTALGPHETVFFYAEHVRHFTDEAFTCLRRQDELEICLMQAITSPDATPNPEFEGLNSSNPWVTTRNETTELPAESLLQHLVRAMSAVFEAAPTSTPDIAAQDVLHWEALTPVGPGAFPVPSVADTPFPGNPSANTKNVLANFPWTTAFLAGHACDAPLPDAAPREHQVIVMRRGGCSYSQKINNIPSFSPDSRSLQLVIVVDEYGGDADEAGMARPLLEVEQITPNGLKRLNGIPMVLMAGEYGDYDLFERAAGVGLRRKYRIYSQGMLVENAAVV